MQYSCTVEHMYGTANGIKLVRQDRRVYRTSQFPIAAEKRGVPYPEHQEDLVWVGLEHVDGRREDVPFSLVTGLPVEVVPRLTHDDWDRSIVIVRLSARSLHNIKSKLPLKGQTLLF